MEAGGLGLAFAKPKAHRRSKHQMQVFYLIHQGSAVMIKPNLG